MILLNERDMWQAVSREDVMTSVEEAYAIRKSGRFHMPDRYLAERDGNIMMYMPCFTDGAIGTKMLAEFPKNPEKGLPFLSGMVILNDAETGKVQAILDGGALTAMRTGAVGGVGIRYLAPEDASSVGLAGCGVQGFHQLLYACTVRPVEKIYLYDIKQPDYEAFAGRLRKRLRELTEKETGGNAAARGQADLPEIIPCGSARELAERSDILISATQTVDPVYPDDTELLRGKTFIAIGSWRPERRELPDAVWKLAEKVYIDLPYACEESGDLKIPLETGLLTPDRVVLMEDRIAECREGKGLTGAGKTQCFKTVGMGLFDVCAAKMLYRKAAELGIGQTVSW